MTRVHSTCARGASAMPVPGCPEFAACGPSIQMPRMMLIARCSRSVSTPLAVILVTLPTPVDSQQGVGGPSVLEQEDGSREAVQEAALADGTDLAGAEHAGSGTAFDVGVDDLCVVIRSTEEVGAAAVAGEHERALSLAPGHQLAQIVIGGRGVAHLELHRRADIDLVADRDRADVAVTAEHGANEEVAAVEFDLVLVDDAAEVDPSLRQLAFFGVELLQQFDEALECRAARQLVDDAAIA